MLSKEGRKPHSILKQSSNPTECRPPAVSREERIKETAIYHANLIQQRKDVEARILAATEALLECPSSPGADPANPFFEDATLIKQLMVPFQPSDFDALIEERNINRQCGYVLCPRPNRQQVTSAKYRILHSGGNGADTLKFIQKGSLEKWCSDDCSKRALFIKIQLSNEPAWTRRHGTVGDLMLLEDNDKHQDVQDQVSLINEMKHLVVSLGEEQAVEEMKTLAIDRGGGNGSGRSLILAEVRENSVSDLRNLPPDGQDSVLRDSVEGYQPRFGTHGTKTCNSEGESEDIMGTI